jgi:hypothetical protein
VGVMENEFFEITFEIESCIKLHSTEIPGNFLHVECEAILIEEKERSVWTSKHKIRFRMHSSVPEERMTQIAEQIRERLVSLFALATEADVSASDEIVFVNLKNRTGHALFRPSFRRELKLLRGNTAEFSINPKMQTCSVAEWNALTRFRKAMMSGSQSEILEAVLGTIDVLGKIDYPLSGVGARIKRYMTKRLSVGDSDAEELAKARNNKIHENADSPELSKLLFEVKDKLIPDLSDRFGFVVINRIRIRDLKVCYSAVEVEESPPKSDDCN